MNILNDGVIIHNIDTVSYINDKALELFNIDNKMKKVLLIDDIKGNINKENRKKFIKGINLVRIGKEEKIINKIETEDAHMTAIKVDESKDIKKAIFKVKII